MRILDKKWQSRYFLMKYVEFGLVSIVFSAVYVLRNGVPSDFLSALKWAVYFALGLMEWLVYFFLFLSLKYNFFRWWQTIRILGFPSSHARRMLRDFATLREHQYRIQWLPLFFVSLPIAVLFYITEIGLFLAILLILIEQALIEYLRRIIPPAVLLLSTTGKNNQRLHARIDFTIRRLRAVALLKLEDSWSDLVSIFSRQDCFRTASEEVWIAVVVEFIDSVPLVVLDVRQISTAVLTEAFRITSRNLTYKLILLVGPTGERPLLDYLSMVEDPMKFQDVPVVREAGLLTMLHYLTRSRNRLPTPDRPLRAIIEQSGKFTIIRRDEWINFEEGWHAKPN